VTFEVETVYTGGSVAIKQPASGRGSYKSQQDVRENILVSPAFNWLPRNPAAKPITIHPSNDIASS
jgi:hypothetical protein